MGQSIPEASPESDETRIIERPAGFYWRSDTTGEEGGPFGTLAEAVEDINAEPAEPEETLEEAEAEIGVSGWIDPDTGDLGESWTPRLEDH